MRLPSRFRLLKTIQECADAVPHTSVSDFPVTYRSDVNLSKIEWPFKRLRKSSAFLCAREAMGSEAKPIACNCIDACVVSLARSPSLQHGK